MALLEVEGLRAGYGSIEVLHGMSLSVEPVVIIGASGAGKTTLLRTICATIRAAKGSVRFDGNEVTRLPPYRIPTLRIAHVPEGRQIFPALTVRENLLVGVYRNRDSQARRRQPDLILGLFPRLKERLAQLGGTLSGGEQQMLALGRRALLLSPKLLMLDESSQGLVPRSSARCTSASTRSMRPEQPILLVEQNITAALRYANRAYMLERGQLVLEGSAEELRGNDEIRRAYLVSRIVDSLLLSGAAQPSDLEIHRHEYEANQ